MLCLPSTESTSLYNKTWLDKVHDTVIITVTAVQVKEERTAGTSQSQIHEPTVRKLYMGKEEPGEGDQLCKTDSFLSHPVFISM